MTLSLQHSSTPWDRTLPKPSSLLPYGGSDAYHRRSTSLLQHHVVGNQVLNENSVYFDENGRRSTVACIPVTRFPEQSAAYTGSSTEAPAYTEPHDHLLRKRTSSVMSTGDTSRSSSPTSTSPVEGSNQFCLCQREPKIPRPRNAFILYRQHHHAAVVAQHPGLPNPDISKIIGDQWRQLPDKAKEEWKALAEDEKARHSQQYPGYRYRPKRNGRSAGQVSTSEGTSVTSETLAHCQKCGGKFMNTPHTPYTPVNPGIAMMPQMHNARMATATQQIVSPPHSGRMRQYHDVYGRPIPPPHDPRFQYAQMQQRIGPAVEGPETKKRRFNGDTIYAASRQPYSDQVYQPSPRERTVSDAVVAGQFHRPNMGPPARTGYPVQMQPSRPPQSQHRRDHSLTLPPLKTPLSQQVPASLSGGPQSQKSGVEAMIMSIPVLNKVKILSQIAPCLAAPGPASPRREIRGAIIAVEAMDPNSVYDMTNSLAEQLEREGKFAVRIFGGPDPYNLLTSSNRASSGEGEHLNVASFLDLISQWHKISKEMQEYITKRPRLGGDSPDDVVMQDRIQSANSGSASDMDNTTSSPRPKTPVSAVSPKTITQTADLSLQSPPASKPQEPEQEHDPTPQAKSRIPASALAQAQAEAEAETQHNRDRSESATPRPQTQPDQATRRATTSQQHHSFTGPMIPVAIVPHYQLTTVDASSIAMPITDAYSPHSHWQWLATLWRGCVGPDVSVIIQAGDVTEESDQHSAGTAGRLPSQTFIAPPPPPPPPSTQPAYITTGITTTPPRPPPQSQQQIQPQQQQQQQHQDVEVRLSDCRAVVVRGVSAAKGRSDPEGGEWWEKAKRRVGFEVEEFLRK